MTITSNIEHKEIDGNTISDFHIHMLNTPTALVEKLEQTIKSLQGAERVFFRGVTRDTDPEAEHGGPFVDKAREMQIKNTLTEMNGGVTPNAYRTDTDDDKDTADEKSARQKWDEITELAKNTDIDERRQLLAFFEKLDELMGIG